MLNKFKIDTLFAVGFGLSWLVLTQVSGLKLTFDSTVYLAYALNMHHADSFFEMTMVPVWPPLYSFLIHIFMFFNIFPAEAAALLNGISLLLCLVVFSLILQRFSHNRLLNLLFLIALCTFTGFLNSYFHIMSEAPFSLFIVIHLYFLIRHHETCQVKYYILAAIFVSLATLTRYMGYSLIITFMGYTIYFLIQNSKNKQNYLWKKYLLWNSITYIPILLYITKNYIYFNVFHGDRQSSNLTIYQNFDRVLTVLTSDLNVFLLTLFALSVLSYVIFAFFNRQKSEKSIALISYILSFIIIYIILLVYTTSQVQVDPISTRYFSPLYACLFIVIVISLNTTLPILTIHHQYFHQLSTVVLYFFILAICVVHLKGFTQFINTIYQKSSSATYYSDIGFKLSPTSKELNNFFETLLLKQDNLYISFLDYGKYSYDGAFFFRYNLITRPEFNNFSFKKLGNQWWSNFNLSFDREGEKKTLHYLTLPHPENNQELVKTIRRILLRKKLNSLWLITDGSWKKSELSKLTTRALQIIIKKEIKPYTIYKFVLKKTRFNFIRMPKYNFGTPQFGVSKC